MAKIIDRDTATAIMFEGGGSTGADRVAAKRSNEFKECIKEFNSSSTKNNIDSATGVIPGAMKYVTRYAAYNMASEQCIQKAINK